MTMKANEEFLDRENGLRIFVRSWHPPGPPRAVVAICHGVKSHSGYYHWLAEQLVASGFAVYALDLRGRGRSGGERFFITDVDEYVGDVSAVIELARRREGDLPLFLFGHSAGGVVSSTYALDNQKRLAGFICESFAYQVYAPDFLLAVIKAISRIVPRLPMLRLKNRDFSRDPAVVALMDADPLIAGEVQPMATVAALSKANDRLKAVFASIRLPVLILHGTEDKVTRPGGSQEFHGKAGSRDKTLKLYDGQSHDLFNDLGRERVLADVVEWLDARLPVTGRVLAVG
ncbi:alpha/beta hydrolase [Microvirga sp. VF16]|uniref:alpha/beta hydrolase n=1 Tax=Microvirga sp. VF16 TaxID=2807101 RepID=UPI00193D1D36|nr:alpha/beta hydrolase [Microvirga sp. VF16]QRM31417.1 lysophospholipase [Microvirga sp. VF16]